eukprot:365137-Chlamydomonas_euryale.AAC.8
MEPRLVQPRLSLRLALMPRSWMCHSVGMSHLPRRPRLQPRLASPSCPRSQSRRGHRTRLPVRVRRVSAACVQGAPHQTPTAMGNKALPSDRAVSEGKEPGSEDDDAAPADDGGADDDAADVQLQLTAIAQRLARDERAQRGRL